MDLLHAGKYFQVAGVEIGARADRRENGLALAGGAVHGEAHADQVFDHILDLLFGCGFLHCDNHRFVVRRWSLVVGSVISWWANDQRLWANDWLSLLPNPVQYRRAPRLRAGVRRDLFVLDLAHYVNDALVDSQQIPFG